MMRMARQRATEAATAAVAAYRAVQGSGQPSTVGRGRRPSRSQAGTVSLPPRHLQTGGAATAWIHRTSALAPVLGETGTSA
jgi:hypothetical protein